VDRQRAAPAGDPWVLVVEDDAKFGDLVARALGRAGFGSVVADCGDAALRAMRIGPPMSAAVVDVMIPHPDGIEVCRHLRRRGWSIPVVAISARSSPTDRARVEAAGADAFLSKPFALADLIDLVRRLMFQRGSRASEPIAIPRPG
jgi:DNA-binding response OmpR family regulator